LGELSVEEPTPAFTRSLDVAILDVAFAPIVFPTVQEFNRSMEKKVKLLTIAPFTAPYAIWYAG
jgi:hypothetical protein